MSEPSADRDPFEVIAESFLARFRAGHRPSIEEYAAGYPELADQIRELLPALVMVEQDLTFDRGAGGDGPRAHSPFSSFKERRLGDYRLLREVGRGGMGVVYEAEQVSLGRRVALKVLPEHLATDATGLERFRREAKAAARLHHTNIVPVHEVGRDGDVAYYAMQFIQGQGLDQVIDELMRLRDAGSKPGETPSPMTGAAGPGHVVIGPIAGSLLRGQVATEASVSPADSPPAASTGSLGFDRIAGAAPDLTTSSFEPPRSHATTASGSRAVLPGGSQASTSYLSGRRATYFRSVARIGYQAAQGLAYAHAGGIVHRDIKPSNLLLDHAGVVWIADFGLAKADDDGLTQTGDLLGTLRYMAPERFRGQGDGRADVYALGLTLYELLTLRPAFESTDRLELIERINSVEPRHPRDVDPRIPRDLETIVLKAIEKDPRARYQSAEAMAEDLRLFLADEPILARQIGTSERYYRWARRNPTIAALVGVLAAVLVATSLGSTWAASYFRTLAGREAVANRQSQLARKQAVEASEAAVTSRQQAILERDRSRRLSAGLALDKGLALAEEGRADRGLLWMLQALRTVPDDDDGFRRAVRLNLGAWIGQVPRPLRIFENGPGNVIAFSPDGGTFAQSDIGWNRSSMSPVSLRETDSGRELASFSDAFSPFAFRPDGRALVASTRDGRRMAAFDLATGRTIWVTPDLPGDSSQSIAFDPDGAMAFVERHHGERGFSFVTLDLGTGRPLGETARLLGRVALAPDTRTMAVGRLEDGQYRVDLIDRASNRRQASWAVGREMIVSFDFSRDGISLVVTQTSDQFNHKATFVRAWDTAGGGPRGRPIPESTSGEYLPAGDRLIVETDFRRAILDRSGRERGSRFLEGGASALHPDGRTVISEDPGFMTRLWQVSADAEPVLVRGPRDESPMPDDPAGRGARRFAYLPRGRLRADGRVAALVAEGPGGRKLVRLVDPASDRPLGKPMPHYPGWELRSFAFSPDGRQFATGSNPPGRDVGVLRIFEADTGRSSIPPIPCTNYVSALAFHPGGRVLASGDFNGLVRFWDVATGREIGRPLSQGEIVLSLAYSPDGKVLAVGLADDKRKPGVRLWDLATRQPIGELLPSVEAVSGIVFRPDGRTFVAGNWRSSRLWDADLRRAVGGPMVGESAGDFSPDGRAFLTLGTDGSLKFRDAATGAVLGNMPRATAPALCAAFRGDGGLVAAGFDDGAIRLWDPATSQQVGPPLLMGTSVRHVGFSPDGRTVYAIDQAEVLRQWPVRDPLGDVGLDDLIMRIEARTGLRMDATGLAVSRLDAATWLRRLEELGRLDPASLRIDDGPAWHEPLAREAERDGNAFAAIWHLDRLIAARPDDWLLWARRAHAWSRFLRPDRAAADYEQASRLVDREAVLDFQNHRAVECIGDRRWAEALWYLDRLVAARPDDGSLHEIRATACGKLGREAERQAELARVFELGADEGMVIQRAEELGRDGRWPEAAALLARRGREGPISKDLAQAWGIACLRAGDRDGYRLVCAAVVAQEGPSPTVFWNACNEAALLALAPGAVDDYGVPIAYHENRLAAIPPPSPVYRHYSSNALGGLLLRAGRVDEAIAVVEAGISAAKEVGFPTDWDYLALAHARLGRFAEARRSLDRLRGGRPDPSISFWDFQEVALLREEAESLLSDAAFPSDPFEGPRSR